MYLRGPCGTYILNLYAIIFFVLKYKIEIILEISQCGLLCSKNHVLQMCSLYTMNIERSIHILFIMVVKHIKMQDCRKRKDRDMGHCSLVSPGCMH